MNHVVDHEDHSEGRATAAVDANAPANVSPPEGWPITLQVAIVFLTLTALALVFAAEGGAAWLFMLVPIAVEYVRYLRSDRCLIVDLLEDASWNRPPGVPSRYAPGDSPPARDDQVNDADAPIAATKMNIRSQLSWTAKETSARFVALRHRIASAHGDEKANVVRLSLIAIGITLAFTTHPVTLALVAAAAIDGLASKQLSVSVLGMLFKEDGSGPSSNESQGRLTESLPSTPTIASSETASAVLTSDEPRGDWKNAA